MKKIPLSPVNTWLEQRTGLQGGALTPESLLYFQLDALRKAMRYARANSRFYAETLRDFDIDGIRSWDDLERIPRCSAADIAAGPERFVCVPQRDIERITTLRTTGSTGAPKRVFFTARDLEIMVQFFHWGMSCLADGSDTVLILMPSATPWSIGDILKKGLIRLGARYVEHGPVADFSAALEAARKNRVTCMVGIPSQVYRMAKLDPTLRPRTVLLSADYVPRSVVDCIEKNWGAEVFNHYGLTESGLAGGVECHAHAGYHMRDADMLCEIVDEQGRHVPAGETGELVFSTLNREAMPLIRYRTGDRAARLTGTCPCGMLLPRIGKVLGRIRNELKLPDGTELSIHALDEIIFALEPVLDYTAALENAAAGQRLRLALLTKGVLDEEELRKALREKLGLRIPVDITAGEGFFTRGPIKREMQMDGGL
jgi:phenylacetate-coenzyme A ligase PaaK-like adenylate-forming protein